MKKFYRPEIDGLRAIAVIGVILYHAELVYSGSQILSGGFLGVDIFFVISGYLITLIIYNEYKEEKYFSYKKFYIRRIRRLVPALVAMICISTILAYFVLLPNQYLTYLNSIVSSIFFTSNFFFHFEGQAYGQNILSANPLLHTWSLAIEEQFYLLYPIFFIFIIRYFRKNYKLIIVIGILSSIIIATKLGISHVSFNFYMLPSRIWELLSGAIVALIYKDNKIKIELFYEKILSIAGLILIILSFFYFDDVNKHPSYLTIIPVLGCCLLLICHNQNNYANKFLSFSILKKLGLISYSLYLWHHPILSFGKISGFTGLDNEILLNKIFLIAISIILAILSYNTIEKKFRKKNNISLKKNFIFFSAIICFIIVISFNTKNHQKKNFPAIVSDLYNQTWFETKQYFKPCFQRKQFFCSFNKKQENTIFLIGDSIMASMQQVVKIISLSNNLNFIPMTNAGCDFFNVNLKKKKNIFYNNKIYDFRKKKINSKKNATIILHINYKNDYFDNEDVIKNFRNDINKYLKTGYKIIFIYPIPQLNNNISDVLSKKLLIDDHEFNTTMNIKDNFINIEYQKFMNESMNVRNLLNSFKQKNIYRIYPEGFFCNTELLDKCIGHNDKEIYFIDSSHLSSQGASLIGKDLKKIIQNLYKNR